MNYGNFTITKEELEQVVTLCRNSDYEAYDELRMASLAKACSTENVENMALALLKGMNSKPVAFIDKSWSLVYYIPPVSLGLKIGDNLYRQQQQARDSCALTDVIAERQRQQSVEGFSTEQDDTYVGCQLAAAAICYIEPMEAMSYWPADWHDDSFKPTNERRNLVKAAALIIAEIERIDRKSNAELTK